MWSKKTSGVIGMIVGGAWFLLNLRHFEEQGFVAIGLPIIIFVLFFQRRIVAGLTSGAVKG